MSEELRNEKAVKKKKARPERGSRKRRLNLLDVLIMICVLALLALLIIVYSPSRLNGINSDTAEIIYSVCISGVSSDYAAAVSVGDTVSDKDGYELGIVASDVEIEPHLTYRYIERPDGSGSICEIDHPDLVDMIITVSAKAVITKDGYTVDGKRIAVEAEYQLVLPKFESKGTCVSLSEEAASDAGASK